MTRHESKYADRGTLARGIDPKTMRPYLKGEAPWEKELDVAATARQTEEAAPGADDLVGLEEMVDGALGDMPAADAELTLKEANKLALRVKRSRDRRAKAHAAVAEMTAELLAPMAQYLAEVDAREDEVEAGCLPPLRAWHEAQRWTDANGKTHNATVTLPCMVKSVSKAKPVRVEVEDEAVFIAWAKGEPALVDVVLRHEPEHLVPESWAPAKTEIKKVFTAAFDGALSGPFMFGEPGAFEVVPGIYAETDGVEFKLETPAVDL